MTRVLVIILGIVFVATASTVVGDDRMHLLDLYNHEAHNDIFQAANFDCKNCHPTDNSFTRSKVDLTGCHKCHNTSNPPAPAAQDCARCHNDNLQPIRPKTHGASWSRIHGAYAKKNGATCTTCHRQNWCVDCHQQRDSIRQTMHPRNYLFYHSIEARANPARCDRCHVVNYCTSCHTLRSIP